MSRRDPSDNDQAFRETTVGEACPSAVAGDGEPDPVVVVQKLAVVPRILDVVCKTTGMGFAGVARVTDKRWICCASRDDIDFGLKPGDELELELTLCNEIRQHQQPIAFDDVQTSPYVAHRVPMTYGFRSYISVPIIRGDGAFFGTLCAIDPDPAPANDALETFKLFADLIAVHLDEAERAAAVADSLISEQSTSALREQFIAVLGHDLRNPLTSIIAGLRLLPKHAPTDISKGILVQMNRSAARMAALIDNLLDFARGRLGDGILLDKAVQPIMPIVNETVDELRLGHIDRQITVNFEGEGEVNCDRGRIAQLVSNLIGNALTHGAQDQPVAVSVTTDEGRLRIAVSNLGTMIPESRAAHLFKPFNRDRKSASLQGLGLGLFISDQIARAHGGSMSVTSSPEETRFVFEMPQYS
jgi:signal transduction histidine kinase